MKETLEVDTRPAEAYITELAKRVDIPIEQAVRFESRAVLQKTMDDARVRSKKTVQKKVRRTFNNYSANGHGKGSSIPKISQGKHKTWFIQQGKEGGLSFLHMDGARRWSAKIWNQYSSLLGRRRAAIEQRTREMIGRRGIPKKSWLMLADLVGLKLRAAGYIVNATANGSTLREVAKVLIDKSPKVFSILFRNSSKAASYWHGERSLLAALRGRMKFFETNLRKGVFDTADAIAKKYPGITVK